MMRWMHTPTPSSLQRAADLHAPAPLHGVQATRRLEASAASTLAPNTLMARAGLAVARLALAVTPGARRIAIAVGPGNNGGDGIEAAAHLHVAGLDVDVVMARDPQSMPSDAKLAFAKAWAAGVRPRLATASVHADAADQDRWTKRWRDHPPDVLIDAMLGIGASRLPEGGFAELWRAVVTCPAPRLAVDLPSGMDADHGTPRPGFQVPKATHTLNLLTLKTGMWTGEGRDLAGDLWIDRLGVDDAADPPAARLWPGRGIAGHTHAHRSMASHKGTLGDVLVVGGADGMLGALVLAASAALHSGCGRVYGVPIASNAVEAQLAATEPGVMWRGPALLSPSALAGNAVVVAGCGGGEAIGKALPALLTHVSRLVLDADALNVVASDASLRRQLDMRSARGNTTVLTPHPLEAARLLSRSSAREVQSNRLEAALELARSTRAVVVLKGAGTVVASPESLAVPWVHAAGNGLLATAGTGDVLAGAVGGLWAAAGGNGGFDAVTCACMAVWRHGATADQAAADGCESLSVSSLPQRMAALRRA